MKAEVIVKDNIHSKDVDIFTVGNVVQMIAYPEVIILITSIESNNRFNGVYLQSCQSNTIGYIATNVAYSAFKQFNGEIIIKI